MFPSKMIAELTLKCLLLVTTATATDKLQRDIGVSSNRLLRIRGGIIETLDRFPFTVATWAQRISSQGLDFATFCGGSLISDEFVLTAAHCLTGNPYSVKLYFGANDTRKDSEPGRLDMKVPTENLIIHEGYDSILKKDDIGLIKLTQKITFTDKIQPVRLVRRHQANLANEVCIITGWGAVGNLDHQTHSNFLRYARILILPDNHCKQIYQAYYHPTNICIQGTHHNACSGDSGGPAVIEEYSVKNFTLVGVASTGYGCEGSYPSSYTRISSYLDWIHKHTAIPINN